MKEWHEKGKRLNDFIRPKTFPIAVKLFRRSSDFPEKVRSPSENLGVKVPICQALSMVRMYRWRMNSSSPFRRQ